jgi:hypothetical protein
VKRSALAVLALGATMAQAADYGFDLSEIEAKPYEWSGFIEGKFERLGLRPNAALYPLTFSGEGVRSTLDRASASAELAGKYQREAFSAYARISGNATHDVFTTDSTGTLLEAGLRWSGSAGMSLDVGKQVQRWGKGYAWNPVAFFERPKDPNDPTTSREGFVMATGEWVKSMSGPFLAAVGFTPVLLPVSSDLNTDYGAAKKTNVGAKLYLLAADTDIDLMWAAQDSRPQRIGFDFSRNIGSSMEVHGEWARSIGATRRVLEPNGTVRSERANVDSWLLGLRYITEREVTWIAELYRNGAGYDEAQLGAFYRALSDAFAPGGSAAAQSQALSLAQSGYGRANPGRHYAYLRISVKDPFDWLYLTPAVTAIVSLDDRSRQITTELVYTGWQNLELRARAVLLNGAPLSEFGAKAATRRLEMSLRFYF